MIRTWLKIDLISNKAIGEINKTIGQLRNNELKALEHKIDTLNDKLNKHINLTN